MRKPLYTPTVDGQPGVLVSAEEMTATVERLYGGPNAHKPMSYGPVFMDLVERTRTKGIDSPDAGNPVPAKPAAPGPEIDMGM